MSREPARSAHCARLPTRTEADRSPMGVMQDLSAVDAIRAAVPSLADRPDGRLRHCQPTGWAPALGRLPRRTGMPWEGLGDGGLYLSQQADVFREPDFLQDR